MKIKTIRPPEVTREQRADEGKFAKSLTSSGNIHSSNIAAEDSPARIKLRPRELISTSKVVLTPESKPSEVLIYAAQTPAYQKGIERGMCLVISSLMRARLITMDQRDETLACIEEKLEQLNSYNGTTNAYLGNALQDYHSKKKGLAMVYHQQDKRNTRIEFQTSGRGTKYYLRFAYRLRALEKSSTTYNIWMEEIQ